MAKRIICYQTRDGVQYDNQLEADTHEAALDLVTAFIGQGFHNDGTIKSLCLSMAKNYDKYEGVLAKFKAQASKRRKQKKVK